MISNDITEDGIEPEPDEALRSVLHTRADLVTITAPPISAVRRRAKWRKRRSLLQGLSGAAATCAVAAGIVAWAPGHDDTASPAPASTDGRSPTRTATPPPKPPSLPKSSPSPPSATQTTPSTWRSAAASDFLRTPDLGTGWTFGSLAILTDHPELTQVGNACENASMRHALQPSPNWIYSQNSPSGKQTDTATETIYTFAPDTGKTAMDGIRTALKTGCGTPQTFKLLASPSTTADDALVYTPGGHTIVILVRNGDLLASTTVDIVPPDSAGTAWTDELAKTMAIRLTTG